MFAFHCASGVLATILVETFSSLQILGFLPKRCSWTRALEGKLSWVRGTVLVCTLMTYHNQILFISISTFTTSHSDDNRIEAMEVNKDEAIRCLDISLKYLDAGNIPSARKFCLKSISLFETPRARKLLEQLDNMTSSAKNNAESNDSLKSQTENGTSATGVKHRKVNGTAGGMGGDKREYTQDQAAVVKRVRSCKATAYYEVLAVKKECDDSDIKKAYRKVSYWTSLEFNSG